MLVNMRFIWLVRINGYLEPNNRIQSINTFKMCLPTKSGILLPGKDISKTPSGFNTPYISLKTVSIVPSTRCSNTSIENTPSIMLFFWGSLVRLHTIFLLLSSYYYLLITIFLLLSKPERASSKIPALAT